MWKDRTFFVSGVPQIPFKDGNIPLHHHLPLCTQPGDAFATIKFGQTFFFSLGEWGGVTPTQVTIPPSLSLRPTLVAPPSSR